MLDSYFKLTVPFELNGLYIWIWDDRWEVIGNFTQQKQNNIVGCYKSTISLIVFVVFKIIFNYTDWPVNLNVSVGINNIFFRERIRLDTGDWSFKRDQALLSVRLRCDFIYSWGDSLPMVCSTVCVCEWVMPTSSCSCTTGEFSQNPKGSDRD